MDIEGGCYCGEVRYTCSGDPVFKGQCHCRECQYASGGGPNIVMGMPASGFSIVSGKPRGFSRSDLEHPVTREFCPTCGTHLLTRSPKLAGLVLLKVGTFDDPSVFGKPDMAIYLCDKQPFHVVPEGTASFDRTPGG